MSEAHLPVMAGEIVELFRPVPAGLVIDATVGAGGHARALLDALPQVEVLGLDRDADALAEATRTLAPFGDRAVLRRARFDRMTATLEALRRDDVAGVLFDLGVSSMQLDRPERGFSYRADGPLDMRMDPGQATTAADVVNRYPEARLADVLHRFGGERFSRRIAAAIVAARPVEGTAALAEIVRTAIPAAARRKGGHPAKRSFQALRIEVNGELAVLPAALDQALAALVPGGRCGVLAYHSGEDRIVKARFVDADTGGCRCPPGLPCGCGAVPEARLLWRGARRPTPEEIAGNRRAESARLRAVEKVGAVL